MLNTGSGYCHSVVSNYPVAWEILEKRYNQFAKIVASHLKALFDVSPLQRPSYQGIQSYLNKLETHCKALQSLNQSTADIVLLYLFTSKLDHETQLRRKKHITRTDHTTFPNVGELFNFLHRRCNVLEAIGSTYQTPSPPKYNLRVRSQGGIRKRTPEPPIRCNFCNNFLTQHEIAKNSCLCRYPRDGN